MLYSDKGDLFWTITVLYRNGAMFSHSLATYHLLQLPGPTCNQCLQTSSLKYAGHFYLSGYGVRNINGSFITWALHFWAKANNSMLENTSLFDIILTLWYNNWWLSMLFFLKGSVLQIQIALSSHSILRRNLKDLMKKTESLLEVSSSFSSTINSTSALYLAPWGNQELA